MTSKEVQSNLEKIHILWMDGDTPSFGWSSPWPWGAFGSFFGGTGEEMDGYWLHEINTEEQTAEILYYVESSDPHVSVWIENIHYAQENGQFQITQEKSISLLTVRMLKRMELHRQMSLIQHMRRESAIRRWTTV